ncbi:hypothetical protein UT4_06630 [Ferrigenium sp. UT4]
MLTQDQKNRIAEVIKKILISRHESFPEPTAEIRNAPFHDLILRAFEERLKPYNVTAAQLIAISSWFHGLSTSLGSSYESIAHILSGGYKRSFTSSFTPKVTVMQEAVIGSIISNLKKDGKPNLIEEDKQILSKECLSDTRVTESLGFSTDVFIERENEIIAIEMKSVRPNSGEGRGEKQKILFGKAAIKGMYPKKNVRFLVGFPFDPTAESATDYNKERFVKYLIEFGKFFDSQEILLGPELWDFLSGQPKTMESVLSLVEETIKQFDPNKPRRNKSSPVAEI